jgi:hypothetical protein
VYTGKITFFIVHILTYKDDYDRLMNYSIYERSSEQCACKSVSSVATQLAAFEELLNSVMLASHIRAQNTCQRTLRECITLSNPRGILKWI